MRGTLVIALGLVVVAGCSGASSTPTTRDFTVANVGATPLHVTTSRSGASILARSADVGDVTRAFLEEHKDTFGIRGSALSLTRSVVDELAMTHARFQQQVSGVPVRGGELIAHYDAAGRLTAVDSTYVPGLDALNVVPSLDARAAVDVARSDAATTAGVNVDEARLESGEAKLMIASGTLAYEVRTRAIFGSKPAIWVTTIDARTGKILDRYDDLETLEGTSAGVLGDVKTIQISQTDGAYSLVDTSRGGAITTSTATGLQVTAEEGAPLVTSSSKTDWDAVDPGTGAAVDAHFYAGVVYDYYKTVFGRDAIDGKGGAMISAAHFGRQYDNAFWDGLSMTYGDGQNYKPLSAALDVCGHEFTHGVTQATSGLGYQGQTGALNEAISDIFGVFIEHGAKPNPVNNWLMGEAVTSDGTGIRDFVVPARGQQPDHMSGYVYAGTDNGGVHINSGIVNNAAYLMTMGGTNPTSQEGPRYGIGFSKSERLWYRVNTKYLTSTATFATAAAASMEAAKDLGFTENEQNIVDCAWKSTGIVNGTCAAIADPNPAPQLERTHAPTERRQIRPDDDSNANSNAPESTLESAALPSTASGEAAGCSAAGHDFAPLGGLATALMLMWLPWIRSSRSRSPRTRTKRDSKRV